MEYKVNVFLAMVHRIGIIVDKSWVQRPTGTLDQPFQWISDRSFEPIEQGRWEDGQKTGLLQ